MGTKEWSRIPDAPVYKAYIRKIAKELEYEFRMSMRRFYEVKVVKRSNVLLKFKYLLFGFPVLLFAFKTVVCIVDQTTDSQVIEQPEDKNDDNNSG